jgi:hypothetical protein
LFLNIKKIGFTFHTEDWHLSKMLTRHFYRDDEVVTALLWCIHKRRVEEGLFWLQELLDSELYDDVFQLLFLGWLWSFGCTQIDWFDAFYAVYKKDNADEEEIVNLFYSLIRLPSEKRDVSVLALLVLGVGADLEPLPLTPRADKIAAGYHDTLRAAFIRYAALGKAKSAWVIAVQLYLTDAAGAWGFLVERGVTTSLKFMAEGLEDTDLKLGCLACAVGFLCIKTKQAPIKIVELDPGTAKKRLEWKRLEGRRARREYEIPVLCLAWITERGSVTYKKHTLGELRKINLDTLRYRACPFWQEAVAKVQDDNDDAIETFWDTHFPDDRPDEWLLEDQKKSHGPGPLALGEERDLVKHMRKWYGSSGSLIVWDCMKDMLRAFDSTKWSDGYAALYQKKNLLHKRPAKLTFKVVKIEGSDVVFTKSVTPPACK